MLSPRWTVACRISLVALIAAASLSLAGSFAAPQSAASATVFPDVPPGNPAYEAVTQLAARGIIYGYANGSFGVNDPALRAHMAGFLVRTASWSDEDHINPFSDQGSIDADLWREVGILAAHGVAHGYGDGTFRPAEAVLHVQAISFITRLMVARGWWTAQGDNSAIYTNVPDSGHRADLSTFVRYAGAIPDRPANQPWSDWNTPASRGWFARVLWQALSTNSGTTSPPAPPVGPPAGATVYWGAYLHDVPWSASSLAAFEAAAGKGEAIMHWGQPWQDRDGTFTPFVAADFTTARAHGAIPMLNWNPWQAGQSSPDQPAWRLATITSGAYDAYIRQFAQAAKAWGQPLFLRMGDEMNGDWYPWAEQANGNQPGDFVRMWRHVHDLFTQVGATNVTWVWCPNTVYPADGSRPASTSLADLYPGDAYVDWVALDGYNWGTVGGNVWTSFADAFGPSYAALGQVAPTKPVMLAEVASAEAGGDKAAWITDALSVQIPQHFPRIRALVWFNWNAPEKSGPTSWVIESSPAAQAAFATAIAAPLYASNQFATLTTSPIPPPQP